MIISLDAGKAFDKIQHHFILKVLERSGIQGQCLNNKSNIQQTNSQYQINGEILEETPLKSGMRHG